MAQKPFGADLDFYDGEWIFPVGLLAISTLYGDYIWTKIVLFIMFSLFSLHILYEHKVAYGKKDLWQRRLMTLGAFIASIFINLIMPVYVIISYAIFSSQLKKDGEGELLIRKRKTYVTMICIIVFAVGVHAWQGFLLINDIQASIDAQNTQGMAGTISQ